MDRQELLMKLVRERDSKAPTRCSRLLETMEGVKRIQLFVRLFSDRSERKYLQELKLLLDESQGDWNYAMYITLFRAAGGSKYKKPYIELARRVPYTAIAQEKASPLLVEAMLLGASGLLDRQKEDRYTIALKSHFDYLQRKHRITPMMAAEWDAQRGSTGDLPYGFPVLRIAQLAGFLSMRDFIFEGVRQCRTPQDVYALLSGRPSEYWTDKFQSRQLDGAVRRMGRDFMDRMAINFVVPLQFAYGDYSGDDMLIQNAQNLVDQIDSESNQIIRLWRGRGVKIERASDSQAILELNNEYCLPARCEECPLGVRLLSPQPVEG